MANDTSKWDALNKRMRQVDRLRVHVGVLASKGGNAKANGSDISLVELAAIHEFGTADGHVPERSFIRGTLYGRIAEELKSKIREVAAAVIAGTLEPKAGLSRIGAYASTEIKKTISMNEADGYGEFPYPPLADSTIAAKGSSTPLVDTGQLLASITWDVVDNPKGNQ